MAGAVDGEAPRVGVAGVAQPTQPQDLAIGQGCIYVGESGPVAGLMRSIYGQRSLARAARRWCRELFVDSGILAIDQCAFESLDATRERLVMPYVSVARRALPDRNA
jgi:hypothetical protein